jgi:predicted CXXCH cytochrome family protein
VKEAKVPQVAGQKGIPGKIIHPLKDLKTLQQIQICSQCHGRNTNKKDSRLAFPVGFLPGDTNAQDLLAFWSYSGDPDPGHFRYFWPNDWAKRNRQQWQDFQKSKHFTKAEVSCLTCHTFHGAWYENQLRLPRETLCVQCHNQEGLAKQPNQEMFEGSPMAKAGTTCVDCHMPKIGYRTTATAVNPQHWDTASHTFMVATPELALQYGVRDSCAACHTEGKLKDNQLPLVPVSANALLKSWQAGVRVSVGKAQAAIREAKAELASAKTANGKKPIIEAAEGKLARATASVNFVLLDGSMGSHNFQKADALLKEAEKLAQDAQKTLMGK